jgi:hypothetical protein
MNKQIRLLILVIGIIISSINLVQAVELRQGGKIVIPDRISEVIKIDGDLNEEVWNQASLSKDFITYQPVYGEVLAQKTEVWMAYDSESLYFAFKCYDSEPNKIKTSISQRDKMYNDDWVAVLIDTMGNKQTSYEFYVNPNGIQGDNLNSAITGLDDAPDFVWESTGKITEDGYQVEIRIPLESIRFRSGKEVQMGILLLRNITRLGAAGAWPETEPGQTDFNFMVKAIYNDLKPIQKLEVLPNFTYSKNDDRANMDSWDHDIAKNIGASIKYGITSSITSEATINPDFSQVESDAFQVEVNQRYPLFYSEKRPFFMEGTDAFDFSSVEHGVMISAIHTRRIVDPSWAAKLSGNAGKMSFAVLAANDQSPGRPWQDGVNPNEGKNALWSIARAKYNLGKDNSLGVLYSGRHFAGGKNDVIGTDLQYRFFKNVKFNFSYLASQTRESSADETRNGYGFNTLLQYITPKLSIWGIFEKYDGEFTMYSAFLNRTNISRGMFYIGPSIYTKIKGASWIRRIAPYFRYMRLHDHGTGMDDWYWWLGVSMHFTKRGRFIFGYQDENEAWQGQTFNQKYFYSWGRVQLFKWLYASGSVRFGDQLYYGPGDPFLGTGNRMELNLTVQPDIKLSLGVGLVHSDLYKKTGNQNKQKFYSVDIFNIHTTYQFNKYFFIRGVVRYNDFQKKLLTDFLASFTLIPGTVMHLGYGSLYERREWQDNRWMTGMGDLLNVRNGLFFKVSYLWRIK